VSVSSRLTQLLSMLLHRHPHSSRRFIVTIICTVITLFHQIECFPVLVKKAGAVSGPPKLPVLPNSDASWFHDSSVMSTLVTRSSVDVVHDGVFIPTIATMGVLVIICIFCSYKLYVSRETAHTRGANIEGPVYSSQYAVGHVESTRGSRVSKSTRGSVLSASATVPVSPSVGSSNMLDRLQRRREEEHRQLPQQDPYERYMSANQGRPQQPYQYTPYPSVPGSVKGSVMPVYPGERVQPQLPRTAHLLTAPPPLMNVNPSRDQPQERESLQQFDPRPGFLRSSAAETSSTRVSSDVLSYADPPEARRPPLLNNSSQPQSQDYITPQHPEGGNLLQTQPSTQGDIAHSPRASSTNSALVRGFTNQPPGYSTEMMKNDVQENVANTGTLRREKDES